ncbi:hypothetical protein D3C81_1849390 [compost metagenome]
MGRQSCRKMTPPGAMAFSVLIRSLSRNSNRCIPSRKARSTPSGKKAFRLRVWKKASLVVWKRCSSGFAPMMSSRNMNWGSTPTLGRSILRRLLPMFTPISK